MSNLIARYAHWLHTHFPAGGVERLSVVNPDGSTNVPGLYIVGDLTGIPLLKFAADTGARAVRTIVEDRAFSSGLSGENFRGFDVAIIGGGVSGFAAAIEAKQHGLRFQIFEAAEPFSTIVNFPKAKPIFTYPTRMTPAGALRFHPETDVKERLLDDLRRQAAEADIQPTIARVSRVVRRDGLLHVEFADPGKPAITARRVILAVGRAGEYRKLDVPGEDLPHVYHRLYDPTDHRGQNVVVVGGGDSAAEAAIALADAGASVTLSYRRPALNRPKPDNLERLNALVSGDAVGSGGKLTLALSTTVKEIQSDAVVFADANGQVRRMGCDVVFAMTGREPPLDFLRRCGVRIAGERTVRWWTTLLAFLLFCVWMSHWKKPSAIPFGLSLPSWLNPQPATLIVWLQSLGGWLGHAFSTPASLLGTIALSAREPGFYYTLVYSVVVVVFGLRRIRYRRTPYVTAQTLTLMAIQVVPLFILPEILLPWLAHNGVFDTGLGAWLRDVFFPGGSWWRSYGLILAWPLFLWNFFTDAPLWGWLLLGFLQTFVLLPGLVFFWGKGAYCGWVCSCGALAETLGDRHRHKMPHGPLWNRLNLLGQVILAAAVVLFLLRILGWLLPPGNWAANLFVLVHREGLFHDKALSYNWLVDLMLSGVLGVGLYFWFSGRVWCRFACPLAALMHIYARLGRFRILADKKKCISCNVCTSVCHQGIDVMSFAQRGEPMADPQCVRCSACVQMCPTGVLSFGQVDRAGRGIKQDPAWLAASPVRMREAALTVNGRAL